MMLLLSRTPKMALKPHLHRSSPINGGQRLLCSLSAYQTDSQFRWPLAATLVTGSEDREKPGNGGQLGKRP